MVESNEKSLKIVNSTIFEKIKNIINKIFKNSKQKGESKLENKNCETEKQEHIVLKSDFKEKEDLIKKIETDKINIEEQKDEELEQINANLARYLEKIQKEIGNNKADKNAVKIQS